MYYPLVLRYETASHRLNDAGAHKHFGVKQRRNFEPFVFIFFAHRHFSSCDGYKHSSSIMIRLRVGVEFPTEKVIIKINKQRDASEFRLYLLLLHFFGFQPIICAKTRGKDKRRYFMELFMSFPHFSIRALFLFF